MLNIKYIRCLFAPNTAENKALKNAFFNILFKQANKFFGKANQRSDSLEYAISHILLLGIALINNINMKYNNKIKEENTNDVTKRSNRLQIRSRYEQKN